MKFCRELYRQFKILGWLEVKRWINILKNKIKKTMMFCPNCRETWEYCDLYCKKNNK